MATRQTKQEKSLEGTSLLDLANEIQSQTMPQLPPVPKGYMNEPILNAGIAPQNIQQDLPGRPQPTIQEVPHTQPAAGAPGELPDTAAATQQTQDTQQGILQPTAQATLQGDIDHALSAYMDQLTNLGPEYGQEMAFLQPYLSANQTSGLAPAAAYTGPNAANVNKAQDQLLQAETGMQNAAENMAPPGFGKAADLAKQYENTLPYQQPIQAELGYQKYLETYGGLAANTTGVPQGIKDIYQAISGTSGGNSPGGGLPTVAQANAASNANKLFASTTQPTPVQH